MENGVKNTSELGDGQELWVGSGSHRTEKATIRVVGDIVCIMGNL